MGKHIMGLISSWFNSIKHITVPYQLIQKRFSYFKDPYIQQKQMKQNPQTLTNQTNMTNNRLKQKTVR